MLSGGSERQRWEPHIHAPGTVINNQFSGPNAWGNYLTALARNEMDPARYEVHVPVDVDVRRIRSAMRMTQAKFAATFGFPVTTLRDWEQGRTRPDMAARSYLPVIRHSPDAVRKALAAA